MSKLQCVSFKPLDATPDLLHHFRLRHTVYVGEGYRPADPSGLDIDVHDLFADHLGAFVGGLMVGGIRLIHERCRSPRASLIRQTGGVRPPARQRLPTLEAHDVTDCFPHHPPEVEFSRTFALPEHRGRRVGLGLAHGAHGLASLLGYRYGIGSCGAHLVRVYEKVGCRAVGPPTAATPSIDSRPRRSRSI